MVKNLPGFKPGLIPGSGRSPGEGNGNPLQIYIFIYIYIYHILFTHLLMGIYVVCTLAIVNHISGTLCTDIWVLALNSFG